MSSAHQSTINGNDTITLIIQDLCNPNGYSIIRWYQRVSRAILRFLKKNILTKERYIEKLHVCLRGFIHTIAESKVREHWNSTPPI